MQSVRYILTARDDMDPSDIDALFADFVAEATDCQALFADLATKEADYQPPPYLEGLMAEFFGLEPDYLLDPEIQHMLSNGVLR